MSEYRRFLQLVAVAGLLVLLDRAAPAQGTTSMDALKGKTWTLVQFDDRSPAPTERAITAVFEKGKISGSGGCNRYSATVSSPSPGAFHVSAISATKMACMGPAGTNEQRYFAALEKVEGFAVEDGRLMLSPGGMVFKAET